MNCYITACGMALPERIVTNVELAPVLGVTPEWIEANSGIVGVRSIEQLAPNATKATETPPIEVGHPIKGNVTKHMKRPSAMVR